VNLQFQQLGWLAVSTVALLFAGCAANPAKPTHSFPPPPTEEVRASLGTITVTSARPQTQAYFATPDSKGKAAATGALEGALYATGVAAQGAAAGPEGLVGAAVVEIVLLPLGTVVGGVVGWFQGTAPAEVKQAQTILANTFAGLDFQAAVRQQVLEAGRRNTRHAFVPANQSEPATPGSPQPSSILEVTVLSAGLAGKREKDASLAMFLRVQVRLLQSPTGPPLYSNTWVQTSGARPFKQWAADNGRAFREELPAASRAVAENIIEEVFLVYRPGKT